MQARQFGAVLIGVSLAFVGAAFVMSAGFGLVTEASKGADQVNGAAIAFLAEYAVVLLAALGLTIVGSILLGRFFRKAIGETWWGWLGYPAVIVVVICLQGMLRSALHLF